MAWHGMMHITKDLLMCEHIFWYTWGCDGWFVTAADDDDDVVRVITRETKDIYNIIKCVHVDNSDTFYL
jgi:hypothetical protein